MTPGPLGNVAGEIRGRARGHGGKKQANHGAGRFTLLKMAVDIVDFPMKNGGFFHSYVQLPEGTCIYPQNCPVLSVNIPAPWFASGFFSPRWEFPNYEMVGVNAQKRYHSDRGIV